MSLEAQLSVVFMIGNFFNYEAPSGELIRRSTVLDMLML